MSLRGKTKLKAETPEGKKDRLRGMTNPITNRGVKGGIWGGIGKKKAQSDLKGMGRKVLRVVKWNPFLDHKNGPTKDKDHSSG